MSVWDSMPKVELHIHLEGAIPADAMWTLVERHGGDPDVPDPGALAARFEFRDFAHFISTWEWKLKFHTTLDDYRFLAEAVARDLARQGHTYVEAYVSPSDSGLATQPMLMAVREGLDVVQGIRVALIPDLVRDTGHVMAMRTLEEVIEVAGDAGVIGVTIGGSEQNHPAVEFVEVFRRVRSAGLGLTAHAGEAAGPESVRQAIDDLGVDRIGHGVRSVEDPVLLVEIVERQIPLEVCPTSNVRTGVSADFASHQVRELIDAGAFVTINTDDPAMFGCTLAGEFSVIESLGYDDDTMRMLAENAIDASWATAVAKRAMHVALAEWWRDHR